MEELIELLRNKDCSLIHLPYPTSNHSDVISSLTNKKLYSIILEWKYPSNQLEENSNFYDKKPVVFASNWEMQYRHETFGCTKDTKIFDGFREKIMDHFSIKPDHEQQIQAFDNFIESYQRRKYVDIFIRAENEWALNVEDIEDEECEVSYVEEMKKKYPEKYQEWYLSFALPDLSFEYSPKLDCIFSEYPLVARLYPSFYKKQYFIVLADEVIKYGTGSTEGSLTREFLGYYGWAFVELQESGKDIPSLYLKIDGEGKTHQELSPRLKLLDPSHGCNYRLDRNSVLRNCVEKYLIKEEKDAIA